MKPITNRSDLEGIASDLKGRYVLLTDIDLSGSPWTPIGTDSHPFLGSFEGNFHIIKGLQIDTTITSSRFVGLFGQIGRIESLEREKHLGSVHNLTMV